MSAFSENDWKQLKSLKETKLNIACQQILKNAKVLIEECSEGNHRTYQPLWRMLNEADNEIIEMFDDIRRSNAIFKLASWRSHRLLSDEELNCFSETTQQSINTIATIQISQKESHGDN